MGFLLAKILFLLVFTALSGALFAYWWFRRHYQDVSLEYAHAREEMASWRARFEERLAQRPEVDLRPLTDQLAALEATVGDLNLAEPNLAPLQVRLDEIERGLSALQQASPGAPPDLEPLAQRLASLEGAVRALPPAPDLSATEKRLTAIEHSLFPVQTRLDELTGALRALRTAPPPGSAAPEPVNSLQMPPDGAPAPEVSAHEGPRNLLTHAGHGKPDDLTQIRGVPKVLERRLHKVGVFYFWQIAEWSPEDVRYVDSQLNDYRGCIERDDWVNQAHELAAAPSAAHPPLEH